MSSLIKRRDRLLLMQQQVQRRSLKGLEAQLKGNLVKSCLELQVGLEIPLQSKKVQRRLLLGGNEELPPRRLRRRK